MKSLCWPLFAISALVAGTLAAPAFAQAGGSAGQQGLSSSQDDTNVTLKIVQLKAQLEAVERETLRRLACQANPDPYGQPEVSTETGCTEIPGLRAYVASQVVSTTAPCNLPWGGTIFDSQSVTAYAATSVPYGQACSSQGRTCNNGTLTGSYTYNSCSVQADPCASMAGLCQTYCATYGYDWTATYVRGCIGFGPNGMR